MSDTIFTQDQALHAIGILKTLPEGSTVFLIRAKDQVWIIRAPIPDQEKDLDGAVQQLLQSLKLISPPEMAIDVRLGSWLGTCIDKAISAVKPEQNDLTWPDGYIFPRAYVTTLPAEDRPPAPNFIMVTIDGDDVQIKASLVSIAASNESSNT